MVGEGRRLAGRRRHVLTRGQLFCASASHSRERVRALGGWAGNGGTEDDYGSGLRARTLYEEICKIGYDGVDLSHIYTD